MLNLVCGLCILFRFFEQPCSLFPGLFERRKFSYTKIILLFYFVGSFFISKIVHSVL